MSDETNKTFVEVLKPSWYEVVVAIVGFIAATFYFVIYYASKTTEQGYYFDASIKGSETFQNLSNVSNAINSSSFAGDVAVFSAWALIGLIAYFVVDAVLRSFKAFSFYVTMMEYFKKNRHQIEVEGLTRLAVRIAAASLLYLYSKVLISWVVPVVVTIVYKSLHSGVYMGVVYAMAALILSVLAAHLLVVLLRVLLLRVRLFKALS